MSKVALITGINGQDGSYLSDLLLTKNYKIHGFVRSNFKPNNSKHNWRIKHLLKKIILHKVDINDHTRLKRLIKKIKPDEFYHLAAQSHDGHSFKNEFYTFNMNLNYTHFLLSSVYNANKKTIFFFAASSEMYIKNPQKKINEKTIFNPSSAYGISKLASYYLIKNYRENYNMHASTGILFNHESPIKDDRFVLRKISMSVAKIKHGKQKYLKLGNIKAKRDWGHAKDFAKAMWMMCQQKKANDFIIGTGKLHSVEDFARLAFKSVNLNYKNYIKIEKNLKREKDSNARTADISKIKKILKWKPKINFRNLVLDMVNKDLKRIKK
jgi:GDPmannose 4,6-dehydratase